MADKNTTNKTRNTTTVQGIIKALPYCCHGFLIYEMVYPGETVRYILFVFPHFLKIIKWMLPYVHSCSTVPVGNRERLFISSLHVSISIIHTDCVCISLSEFQLAVGILFAYVYCYISCKKITLVSQFFLFVIANIILTFLTCAQSLTNSRIILISWQSIRRFRDICC